MLRRAADAMEAEADRLDALDKAATGAPWVDDTTEIYAEYQGGTWVGETCNIDLPADERAGNTGLIVHRRNTLARDAATLRALAALLRMVAARHHELLSNFRDDSEAARLIAWTNTPLMAEAEQAAFAFLGEETP